MNAVFIIDLLLGEWECQMGRRVPFNLINKQTNNTQEMSYENNKRF